MHADDLPSIDPNVDYTQILPIQQKRTIAFINHFVMNTVAFLNKFAQSCESRLMEFEYKLQKVEASLTILESQLSSISSLDHDETPTGTVQNQNATIQQPAEDEIDTVDLPDVATVETSSTPKSKEPMGPVASEDPRFQRFFKMVQFGVPAAAVKLKMQTEGIEPNILDNPSAVIPGYSPAQDAPDTSDTV